MSPGADGGFHPDDLSHPDFDPLRAGLERAELHRRVDEAEAQAAQHRATEGWFPTPGELRRQLDAEEAAERELAKLRAQVEADALREAYGLEALDFGPQREPGDLFSRNAIVILPEERLDLTVVRPAVDSMRSELETQVWGAFDIPESLRTPRPFYAPALVRHNVEVCRLFGFPHPRNVGAAALLPNRPVFPLRDRALPGRSVRRPATARLAVLAARRKRNS